MNRALLDLSASPQVKISYKTPNLLFAVDTSSGDLPGCAAKVGVLLELDVALVIRAVVDDTHFADVVDPDLPDDNVVDLGLDLGSGALI